ncbi:hypothetical protein [Undibacterium sp. Ji49W]|uniref:hypothetical protein n=1 Tax=Undibacterium sp. Ji49W TaxID=3413040 RepID=UPI003BF264D8
MNIVLLERKSLEEVVALVISMGMQSADYELVQKALIEDLGLSSEDAALAWDRVHGGIVRASTGRNDNCPDKTKDPLAWLSFQKASDDISIISSLYPQYAKPVVEKPRYAKPVINKLQYPNQIDRKPWWKFW